MSRKVSASLLATQSDERLLELMRDGHDRAFEAIVIRYGRALRAYCRRIGLSDARADDVLQQSFLKAWLSLQAGTDVRLLRPWLYRIVHNTAVNAIRSSAPERFATQAPQIELVAGPETALDDRIAAHEALADLASLPRMQREAIVLSAFDGRSHEEIAWALGVSATAVRGLLYRARSAMRAAAAAFTPGSLISWAAGGARRAAPSTARLAELSSASGAGDTSAMLLKGAALAGSAALAAGAVFVPLHARATRTPDQNSLRPAVSVKAPVATSSTPPTTASPGGVRRTGGEQGSESTPASREASQGARSSTPAVSTAPVTAPPAGQGSPSYSPVTTTGKASLPSGASVLVAPAGGGAGTTGASGGQAPKTGSAEQPGENEGGSGGENEGGQGSGSEAPKAGGTGTGSSGSDDSEEASGTAGSGKQAGGETDDSNEGRGSSTATHTESGADS